MRLNVGLVLLASAIPAGAALAHHGWGSYDAANVMTISSPVASVEWGNPHVHLMVHHEGAMWEVTLAPPSRMQTRGLAPELLKEGTPVVVEGYPSTRNQNELRAERITVAERTVELR